MPCDTVSQVTVQFTAANTDTILLAKALTEMGYTATEDGDQIAFFNRRVRGTYERETGNVTFTNLDRSEADEQVKLMKKHYSAQVVKGQAAKFGWKVKQLGQFEFELEKRTL